jgi:hypothetical protein
MLKQLATIMCVASLLSAEIFKFDDEDMRDLRASDPYDLFVFPGNYAFSQAMQLSKENGYRYFSFVFYDCNLEPLQTTAYFNPPSASGEVLCYDDEWISLEIIGYLYPPDDTLDYTIILGDQEID